jgi:L-serine kinase (ADP)
LAAEVSVDGLRIELSITSLEEVKPHEATIPKILDSIIADLERTNLQRDPILIDKRTHAALDGMHRRAALAALGARFSLCSQYDYLNDSVKLERWLRYFIAPSEEFLSEVTSLLQLREYSHFEEAVRAVDRGQSRIALLSAGESFVSEREWNVPQVYQAVSQIDKLCQKHRIELDYTPESSKFDLFTSESVYLLYPEKLSKKDVLEVASKGKVLPCKTTRHVVPVRPMGLYFPLDLLKESSEATCYRELKNIVSSSKIELEKREVWYEGRRYSEPLAIFRRNR